MNIKRFFSKFQTKIQGLPLSAVGLRGLFAAIVVVSVSGCVSVKAYVDPQYHKASYETVQRLATPLPVKVDVQFQRNGEAFPSADNELRGHVERTLRATGVFAPSPTVTTPVISVTANNFGDTGAAAAKGVGTGLTLGLAGSMVDDNYEFSCAFNDGANVQKLTYKHIIHSTVGLHEPPAGLTPTTLADAFGKVVEDVILNFVKDLEDKGVIKVSPGI